MIINLPRIYNSNMAANESVFLRRIRDVVGLSSRGGTGYAGSLRGNSINFRGNTLTPVTSYISLT